MIVKVLHPDKTWNHRVRKALELVVIWPESFWAANDPSLLSKEAF